MAAPIFLIGYRCTGKTTTGKRLAEMLGRSFVDTDRLLETTAGTTITRMVDSRGWEYFRKEETRTLTSLDLSRALVVATGGGIILSEENRGFIRKNGPAIWLKADVDTIMTRLASDSGTADSRPALTNTGIAEETSRMLDIRTPLYSGLATFSINTADHTPEAAAEIIIRKLENERF